MRPLGLPGAWALRIDGPSGTKVRFYRTYCRAAEACAAFLWAALAEATHAATFGTPFPGDTSVVISRGGDRIISVRHTETGVTVDTGKGAWPLGSAWHRVSPQLADIVTAVGDIRGFAGMPVLE